MIHRTVIVVFVFLLGLVAFSVASDDNRRFSHPLDGLNLLDDTRRIVSPKNQRDGTSFERNSKLLVDIHIHEHVILTDLHLQQLNRIVLGETSEKLQTLSGSDNRVFRTRLSLNDIQTIQRDPSYKEHIKRIERVSNDKRMLFPQFSMDSLRFSKVRVVMNTEQDLPQFLAKFNTKFHQEFSSQLMKSSNYRNSERYDEVFTSSSIKIEEKGRMFSLSLNDNQNNMWNHQTRNSLTAHMSDFLMSNIFENENVDYIEREYTQSLLIFGINNVVQTNRKMNVSRFAWENGVTGKGEIVNIVDSGIDYSHCFFSAPNEDYSYLNVNNRKIVKYEKGKTGDFYDANGHGTHCSGIIAGNPSSPSAIDQDIGVAKDAKIHMIDAGISILFSVDNMTTILTSASKSGARISSNSWGNTNNLDCLFDCDCYESRSNYTKKVSDDYCLSQYGVRCCQIGNTYETLSSQIDEYTNANDEMLVVFAAGNSGYFGSEKSVISPSTAKNCLSVGASYATSDEYTRYDPNVSTSLYNHDNMGYFSARGPSYDGRIKPDVVAPGVKIWSARSYIAFCDSGGLMQKSGTSFACPTISGVSALVREYLLQNNKQRLTKFDLVNKSDSQTLSGMLVKAFIIHSGEKMMGTVKLDGDFTNDRNYYDLSKENSPNKYTGYGRVNIANTMKFSDKDSNSELFTINRQKIIPSSNMTISFKLNNNNNTSTNQLKVTLTWFDLKGTPANPSNRNSKQLINDLDLSVSILEDSTITTLCYGNQQCQYGSIQASSLVDVLNTVESLTLNIPSNISNSSSIIINIKASEKNVGSQNFALLISGNFMQVSSVQLPQEAVVSLASSIKSYSLLFVMMILLLNIFLINNM